MTTWSRPPACSKENTATYSLSEASISSGRLCATRWRGPTWWMTPRFNSLAARAQNIKEVIRIVQDWVDSTKDDEDVERALETHRVPYAPALTVEQAMNHPHLRYRRTVRTIRDRFLGEFDVPGFPLRFSEYAELELEAPTMGEHNAQILSEYLGYSTDRIDELDRAGVLHHGPR
ncbi:MAG TPA: CoA transferase [Candidatus Binataceae bacterium]|nr:CoA transferase [Candidatus Binataceae bacterium]